MPALFPPDLLARDEPVAEKWVDDDTPDNVTFNHAVGSEDGFFSHGIKYAASLDP